MIGVLRYLFGWYLDAFALGYDPVARSSSVILDGVQHEALLSISPFAPGSLRAGTIDKLGPRGMCRSPGAQKKQHARAELPRDVRQARAGDLHG